MTVPVAALLALLAVLIAALLAAVPVVSLRLSIAVIAAPACILLRPMMFGGPLGRVRR